MLPIPVGYARDQKLESAIGARDLHLLGRKLYAAFQRKAGKLELVNPGISPDISEDSLAFVHASASVGSIRGWGMVAEPLPDSPGKSGQCLTALGVPV